jgi:ABC-type uncharacterized transport system involved in gliding motility auxiliary subunit
MKKNVLTSWIGLALLFVVLGLAVALAKGLGLRLDVTQQRLYSLSNGSKELLQKLPQDAEVTLKFYYSRSSDKMPVFYKAYADQVDYLLKSYATRSKGRVKVERFDPQPDSEAEEWAQRYGIEGQSVDPFAPPVYFGLAVVSGTREEVLPVLSPRTEETLEYDISRAIARVAWPRQPVVGVMSSLAVLGDEPNPMMMMQRRPPQNPGWISFQQLRRDNEVRRVAADAEAIPPDITLLVLAHAKELSDATLYAVDQFVLRGGRLMVCVDPFSVTEAMQSQQMMAPPTSSLARLFDAWGVGFDPSKIVADMKAVTRVGTGNGGAEDSPLFLSLRRENFNAGVSLTSRLSSMMMPFAGSLENRGMAGVDFTPLVESSATDASLVDVMAVQYGRLPTLVPSGRAYTLAARLNGVFKTAFPDGRPASENPENPADGITPHLASGESAVVIFADADFLFNQFSAQQTFFGVQPMNDNIALFLNAAEQLTGRNELISIRTRANSLRPFAVVDELEAEARRQFQKKEDELQQKLGDANRKIQELQAARTDNSIMLSKEQQEQIQKFREEQRDTNRQLKNVRRDLRQDIERLGVRVKAANILLLPALVILAGLTRIALRKRR